jgi:AraC family transcriptional regulator
MHPTIVSSPEKKIIGKRMTMSLADNKMADLWKSFGVRRKEISNAVSNDLISLVVYSPGYFENFKPTNSFERWAAAEVSDLGTIPLDMDSYIVPGGLYAVFNYTGLNTDSSIFQYIFGTWLPASEYELDDRAHFEVLGERYKNNDPTSEEEIWIPVKLKKA